MIVAAMIACVGSWNIEWRRFIGSAQESDEVRILGGFLESDEFCLGGGQALCLQ